jgi:hypothetical protein
LIKQVAEGSTISGPWPVRSTRKSSLA